MPTLQTPVPQTASTPGLSTFDSMWREVLLRVPIAGPMLSRIWIRDAFRALVERRRWSWLVKRGQFVVNPVYKTGSATVNTGQNVVTGSGTAWDATMVGRQFRIASSFPIYTITEVDVANQVLTLDDVWGGPAFVGNANYQIWNAYFTVPSDFHSFISVWDPAFNWQLWRNIAQEELNSWDAQRSQQGTAWAVVSYGYDTVTNPPLPRYELWPHQMSQKPYPFLYETRPLDLDAGGALPRYIPGNVLINKALAEAAKWPGPSRENPNPHFNITLARMLEMAWERDVAELERQDDEIYELDVRYHAFIGLPFAPLPLGDAAWLQAHAV